MEPHDPDESSRLAAWRAFYEDGSTSDDPDDVIPETPPFRTPTALALPSLGKESSVSIFAVDTDAAMQQLTPIVEARDTLSRPLPAITESALIPAPVRDQGHRHKLAAACD